MTSRYNFRSLPPTGDTSGANQSDRPRPSSKQTAQRPPKGKLPEDYRNCNSKTDNNDWWNNNNGNMHASTRHGGSDTNDTNHSYKENYANQQQGPPMMGNNNMMMNGSGNQDMSMMNGSGNNMMTMNRSGNSNRMMNSGMMLNSRQGNMEHTTSHHQQPAMAYVPDEFDFVKEEMKKETTTSTSQRKAKSRKAKSSPKAKLKPKPKPTLSSEDSQSIRRVLPYVSEDKLKSVLGVTTPVTISASSGIKAIRDYLATEHADSMNKLRLILPNASDDELYGMLYEDDKAAQDSVKKVCSYYTTLIKSSKSDDSKSDDDMYTLVMDGFKELMMLMNNRQPNQEEIDAAFDMVKSYIELRGDYHNNEPDGGKYPYDSFILSLKQVTPETLHFIIILMLCPRKLYNAEGTFSDPDGNTNCDSLLVLDAFSSLMIESCVKHQNKKNFLVMNFRSFCNAKTEVDKDGHRHTHCGKGKDDEAKRRGSFLNVVGAFLRFCKVLTLLASMGGEGVLKIKNYINPAMFTVMSLHSGHAHTLRNYLPIHEDIETHMASVYERTLSPCNAYDLFLSHVEKRAAELKVELELELPRETMINRFMAHPAVPLLGNQFDQADVSSAKEFRSAPWGRNKNGLSIYHQHIGTLGGTLGGEACRDKMNAKCGFDESGKSIYYQQIGEDPNLLSRMAAELHDLRGDFTNLASLNGVFEDDTEFKALFDKYKPDELLNKLKAIHNKKMNATATFEFELKDVLSRKKKMGFKFSRAFSRGKKSIRIADEDILPGSLGSEAVSTDASYCSGKLKLTNGMEVKCYNGENIEGYDDVDGVLPPLWAKAMESGRLTMEVFSYTSYRDVGPK